MSSWLGQLLRRKTEGDTVYFSGSILLPEREEDLSAIVNFYDPTQERGTGGQWIDEGKGSKTKKGHSTQSKAAPQPKAQSTGTAIAEKPVSMVQGPAAPGPAVSAPKPVSYNGATITPQLSGGYDINVGGKPYSLKDPISLQAAIATVGYMAEYEAGEKKPEDKASAQAFSQMLRAAIADASQQMQVSDPQAYAVLMQNLKDKKAKETKTKKTNQGKGEKANTTSAANKAKEQAGQPKEISEGGSTLTVTPAVTATADAFNLDTSKKLKDIADELEAGKQDAITNNAEQDVYSLIAKEAKDAYEDYTQYLQKGVLTPHAKTALGATAAKPATPAAPPSTTSTGKPDANGIIEGPGGYLAIQFPGAFTTKLEYDPATKKYAVYQGGKPFLMEDTADYNATIGNHTVSNFEVVVQTLKDISEKLDPEGYELGSLDAGQLKRYTLAKTLLEGMIGQFLSEQEAKPKNKTAYKKWLHQYEQKMGKPYDPSQVLNGPPAPPVTDIPVETDQFKLGYTDITLGKNTKTGKVSLNIDGVQYKTSDPASQLQALNDQLEYARNKIEDIQSSSGPYYDEDTLKQYQSGKAKLEQAVLDVTKYMLGDIPPGPTLPNGLPQGFYIKAADDADALVAKKQKDYEDEKARNKFSYETSLAETAVEEAQGAATGAKRLAEIAQLTDPKAKVQELTAQIEKIYAEKPKTAEFIVKVKDLKAYITYIGDIHHVYGQGDYGSFLSDIYQPNEQMKVPKFVDTNGNVLDPGRYDQAGSSFRVVTHGEMSKYAQWKSLHDTMPQTEMDALRGYMDGEYTQMSGASRAGAANKTKAPFDPAKALKNFGEASVASTWEFSRKPDAEDEFMTQYGGPVAWVPGKTDAQGDYYPGYYQSSETFVKQKNDFIKAHQAEYDSFIAADKAKYMASAKGTFLEDAEEAYNSKISVPTYPAHIMADVKQLAHVFTRPEARIPDNIIVFRKGHVTDIDDPTHVSTQSYGPSNSPITSSGEWHQGAILEDKGFVSTSLDVDTAEEFSGDRMAIELPQGSLGVYAQATAVPEDPDYPSSYGGEEEVILPPGSRFAYLGSTMSAGGETYMRLRYLGPGYDPSVPFATYEERLKAQNDHVAGELDWPEDVSEEQLKGVPKSVANELPVVGKRKGKNLVPVQAQAAFNSILALFTGTTKVVHGASSQGGQDTQGRYTWQKGDLHDTGLHIDVNVMPGTVFELPLPVKPANFAYDASQQRGWHGRWVNEGKADAVVAGSKQEKAQGQAHQELVADGPVPELNAADVQNRHTGTGAGSNTGGIWTGTDKVQRYVKEYKEPTQAYSEVLANSIYRDLGIPAPKSNVVHDSQGNKSYASEMLPGATVNDQMGRKGVTRERADNFLNGFAADVLMANRDVVGLNFDNPIEHEGQQYRIDNGSAFLHRAQGARKDTQGLEDAGEWDTLSAGPKNRNQNYASIWHAAGFKGPDDPGFKDRADKQIGDIEALRSKYGNWKNYVERRVPNMPAEDKASIINMLEKRTQSLSGKRSKAAFSAPTDVFFNDALFYDPTQQRGFHGMWVDEGKGRQPGAKGAYRPPTTPSGHVLDQSAPLDKQIVDTALSGKASMFDIAGVKQAAHELGYNELEQYAAEQQQNDDKATWFTKIMSLSENVELERAREHGEQPWKQDPFGKELPTLANLGVTPYRGKPLHEVQDTAEYYQSTRYKGWLRDVRMEARRLDVQLQDVVKANGIWQGSLEPSASVWVKGEPSHVEELAKSLGGEYNQDGVMLFTGDTDDGKGALYTMPGIKDPDKAIKAMQTHGVDGARLVQNKQGDSTLEVVDMDGSMYDGVAALAKDLGADLYATPGTAKLLEAGTDYQKHPRQQAGRGKTYEEEKAPKLLKEYQDEYEGPKKMVGSTWRVH